MQNAAQHPHVGSRSDEQQVFLALPSLASEYQGLHVQIHLPRRGEAGKVVAAVFTSVFWPVCRRSEAM